MERSEEEANVALNDKTRTQLLQIAQTTKQLQDTFKVIIDTYLDANNWGSSTDWEITQDFKYLVKKAKKEI